MAGAGKNFPGKKNWDIHDGDYQRNRNISNRDIYKKRKSRILKSIIYLLIFLVIVSLVSFFVVKTFLPHH